MTSKSYLKNGMILLKAMMVNGLLAIIVEAILLTMMRSLFAKNGSKVCDIYIILIGTSMS